MKSDRAAVAGEGNSGVANRGGDRTKTLTSPVLRATGLLDLKVDAKGRQQIVVQCSIRRNPFQDSC